MNRFSSSVVITSHDISDIYLMSERYIIFDNGKVILDINRTDFSEKYNYKKINIVSKEPIFCSELNEQVSEIKFMKKSKKTLKDDIYEYELIIDQKYTEDVISITNKHEIFELQVSNINLEDFIILFKEGLICGNM